MSTFLFFQFFLSVFLFLLIEHFTKKIKNSSFFFIFYSFFFSLFFFLQFTQNNAVSFLNCINLKVFFSPIIITIIVTHINYNTYTILWHIVQYYLKAKEEKKKKVFSSNNEESWRRNSAVTIAVVVGGVKISSYFFNCSAIMTTLIQ